jgi:iduronate 2-sulfatase
MCRFIISDDLRPTLGVYGTQALTPHIDALARRGVTFTRAYTQFPWCSPTRQSFLTGRRPDTTKAWTFTTSFRDSMPDAISLPQHFRRQGWWSASVGKIYHGQNCVRGDPGCCPTPPNVANATRNSTFQGCVQQPPDADWAGGSWDARPVDFARVGCPKGAHNWCENDDVPESEYCDFKVAAGAIARLRSHADRHTEQPIFLGVGFRDNHLPWASPAKWRALFPDPTEVKATARGATPDFTSTPRQAWQFPCWVGKAHNLSDTKWLQPPELQEALRSYMANIAFTDAQLGKVLITLDDIGYTNHSLILFTGDHGQNLGEHNTWTKVRCSAAAANLSS